MSHAAAVAIMRQCQSLGLVSDCEIAAAEKLTNGDSPWTALLNAAESLHVHLKVDDTATLPRDAFQALGGDVEFEKDGFIKFRFPDGARIICSSIAVSQDELAENGDAKPRPFVDHFGVDLRDTSDASKRLFDDVPQTAAQLGWDHVPQGGNGVGVHCCHTEVQAKHWAYPPTSWDGLSIPVEVAFGELKINTGSSGCDLRPMHPAKQAAMGDNATPCCGS